jgi:hypothetical protein
LTATLGGPRASERSPSRSRRSAMPWASAQIEFTRRRKLRKPDLKARRSALFTPCFSAFLLPLGAPRFRAASAGKRDVCETELFVLFGEKSPPPSPLLRKVAPGKPSPDPRSPRAEPDATELFVLFGDWDAFCIVPASRACTKLADISESATTDASGSSAIILARAAARA